MLLCEAYADETDALSKLVSVSVHSTWQKLILCSLVCTVSRTIREEFTESTLITIAHRLTSKTQLLLHNSSTKRLINLLGSGPAIIDYDKILFLDAGRIVEFDSPRTLLKDSSSRFYKVSDDFRGAFGHE
jgi:hypothetical protein